MSKAFTNEDAPADLTPARPLPTLAPGEVRYITREGHAALLAERDGLEASRKEVLRKGGLDAQVRERELLARVEALTALLGLLTVAEPPAEGETRIRFGARVELEDEDAKLTGYRIVGPDESDLKAGKLSVDAPLARQLIGRSEGDVVEIHRPLGTTEFTVKSVRYDPTPG